MTSILVAVVLSIDPGTYYSGNAQAKIPASAYYNPVPQKTEDQKQPLVEEQDESNTDPENAVPDDGLRVVIYVDLADVPKLRTLLTQCDRLPGLRMEYKDKDSLPDSGKRLKLPLAQFHTNDGWKFREWRDAEDFRSYWIKHNTSADGRIPTAALRVPTDIAEQEVAGGKPIGTATLSRRYPAWSYEWHITQGESIHSLRSHLSVPRREHHGASFQRAWLDTLSFIDLVGLHSDAHNNRVRWEFVGTQAKGQAVGSRDSRTERRATKKSEPIASVSGSWFVDILRPKRTRRRSSGNCPNGMCPR